MSLTPSNLTPFDTRTPCGCSYGQVTIASGQSLSGAIDLGFGTPVALMLPSSWTSAGVSFAVSYDGTTFGPFYDAAGEVTSTTTFAGGEVMALSALTFLGARLLKVRSGTAGSAVAQGADRIVTLIVKNLN